MNEVKSNLAKNLKTIRVARGLTQAGLAKLLNLPRTTVTYIESGEGNPSLETLTKIGNGLQVSLEELLTIPRNNIEFKKAVDFKVKKSIESVLKVYDLIPDSIPGITLEKIELEKNGKFRGSPHLPQTKEYFYCLEGEFEITVAKNRYLLKKNDLLSFPGDQNHFYLNLNRAKSIGISLVLFAN